MNHFTNKLGWNAIRSQPAWLFRATQPPGGHPVGAYFTTLGASDKHLARRLRIPKSKLEYNFEFMDRGELTPLDGDRGRWIFYSRVDYTVTEAHQISEGATGL